MDIATRHEVETRRIVANATQLNKVTGGPGRETRGFRDWSFKGTRRSARSHVLSGSGVGVRIWYLCAGCGLGWPSADASDALSREFPMIGPGPISAATSDTAEDTGATRCSIRDPTTAGASFGSLFGGLQFGYNYLLPSRLLVGVEGDISFPNFLDDGIVAARDQPHQRRHRKARLRLDAARPGRLRIRSLAFLRNRRPRLVASAVPRGLRPDRQRGQDLANARRAGLWARAPNLPSHQAGLPDWNISTTTWEKPAALFHRALAYESTDG